MCKKLYSGRTSLSVHDAFLQKRTVGLLGNQNENGDCDWYAQDIERDLKYLNFMSLSTRAKHVEKRVMHCRLQKRQKRPYLP